MKHRAPQPDLPGTHHAFNLANGEGIDWQARQIAKEHFDKMRAALDSKQPELFFSMTPTTPNTKETA